MKLIYLYIASALLFSACTETQPSMIQSSQAQVNDLWSSDQINIVDEEKYRWLYDMLIPENIRTEHPEEAFKSFKVHLQDTNQFFPDPAQIISPHIKLVPRIEGRILYIGMVKKRYTYDISQTESKKVLFNIKVHLQGATADDIKNFSAKMKDAQEIWNKHRVMTDFQYGFQFEIVTDVKQAHFSVRVLNSTRGPYDQFWGRDWDSITIAHEVGHMLGLGDEYQTITGKFDCWRASLMCSSSRGEPKKHHYYFILRRLVSQN